MTSRRIRRAARQLFRLCRAGGRLDEARVRDVASRLASSTRRGSHSVLWAFMRLVRLDLEQHTAIVESAAPLPDDVRAGVTSRLSARYGDGVTTTFAVNPALIGGMRIKIGSEVYDESVRARLTALEGRL